MFPLSAECLLSRKSHAASEGEIIIFQNYSIFIGWAPAALDEIKSSTCRDNGTVRRRRIKASGSRGGCPIERHARPPAAPVPLKTHCSVLSAINPPSPRSSARRSRAL